MDENWLRQIFAPALVSCKVIRHKTTQVSRGYGFLLFNSHEAASNVLELLNGKLIPGTEQVFRLNWAANGQQGSAASNDYSLFVGDLVEDVTDYMLQEAFRRVYPSVRSAKVMRAPLSGRSRNFGFCRFADELERDRALLEMNGHEICGKPVRVSLATSKKTQPGALHADATAFGDSEKSVLFVGGLPKHYTADEVKGVFSLFGELTDVKVLASQGCGLVHFASPASAKAAMTMLQDQVIAGSTIKLSWSRQNSQAECPPQLHPLVSQAAQLPALPGSGVVDANSFLPFSSQASLPFPASHLGYQAGFDPYVLQAAGLSQAGIAQILAPQANLVDQGYNGYTAQLGLSHLRPFL